METWVYMVRHGHSDKSTGTERSRGLSARGQEEALKVTARLREEGIAALYSSPYTRAVDTIAGLAAELGLSIVADENLRETHFNGENRTMTDAELDLVLDAMFADPDYTPPGGESLNVCRTRAVQALKQIVRNHAGQRIAIGTHGLVMTLMLNAYLPEYGLEFLLGTSKPDIYVLKFTEELLQGVERMSL